MCFPNAIGTQRNCKESIYLMSKEYTDKLRNPMWQRKRLEILSRDNFCCQICFANDKELQVHHLAYFKGEPWDIDSDFLITLCDDCHEYETIHYKKEIEKLIQALKRKKYMTKNIMSLRDSLILLAGENSNPRNYGINISFG